jgi:16S rRNA processing protein RimM
MTELLLVGKVARAHGNKGQVIVNPETDFVHERFAAGNVLVIEQRGATVERRITAVRFHAGRPILALDGVATMNEAEALAGAELKMPASALRPLPEHTYYRHALVGCEVQDTTGRAIGRVVEVEGPLEQSRLVVEGERGEVLIPMVEGFIVRIDTDARYVIVNLPEGLMEVNAPTRTSDSE